MEASLNHPCLEGVASAIREFESGPHWIARRDAADVLSLSAREIILTLRKGAADPDPDVSLACKQAMEHLTADLTTELNALESDIASRRRVLSAANPSVTAVAPSISDVHRWLQNAAKAAGGTFEANAEHLSLTIPMQGGRHQTVHVDLEQRDSSGESLLFMHTLCGEFPPTAYAQALASNAQLSHASFALLKSGGKETLMLVYRRPVAQVTQSLLGTHLLYLAKKGDQVEAQLRSDDRY